MWWNILNSVEPNYREIVRQFLVKEFILDSLGTTTLKQSSITTFGTLVNAALGAIFYILMARLLGPLNFGLFTIAVATLTLVSDIGNLGSDTGLVKFVSKYILENEPKAFRFLKLALELKVFISLFVIILGWYISANLATQVFKKEVLEYPLKLAFIGVGSSLLFSFSTSASQALQKFTKWSILLVGTNSLRLALILVLFLLGRLDLETGLLTYILVPFIGFLGFFLFLPRKFLLVNNERTVSHEYFHYSKWIALFTLIAAISSRLDIFFSARLLSSDQVGLYSAANQLVTIVPQLAGALGIVIAPKMALLTSKVDFLNYLKKTQMLVVGMAVVGVASIPLVVRMIPLVYGPSYAILVPNVFTILMLAMLIFFISVPVHNAILYYYGYPKLFAWVSLGNLVLTAILGWILITNLGPIGAALVVLIGNTFNLIIPLIWIVSKIRK